LNPSSSSSNFLALSRSWFFLFSLFFRPSLSLSLSPSQISIRSQSVSAGRWLLKRRATFYFCEHRSREVEKREGGGEVVAPKARERSISGIVVFRSTASSFFRPRKERTVSLVDTDAQPRRQRTQGHPRMELRREQVAGGKNKTSTLLFAFPRFAVDKKSGRSEENDADGEEEEEEETPLARPSHPRGSGHPDPAEAVPSLSAPGLQAGSTTLVGALLRCFRCFFSSSPPSTSLGIRASLSTSE